MKMAMSFVISQLTLEMLLLLVLCLFFFCLYCLILGRFRELSGQLGPPTYPILGCLISFSKNQHRLLDWYTELLEESPTQTIVVHRLGARRTIVTANPDNVEYMLKTKFENFPKGEPFTEILGDLLGRGIFNVDGELWHTQRKLASHEFSCRSLREFMVKTLESEANERLLPMLESACVSGGVVDLQELLRRFAFDIICKVSLGIDPGCLDPFLPVSELLRAFDVASEISAKRGAAPIFAVWKMKRAVNIGSERRLKEAIRYIHASVMELIRRKKLANEREAREGREGESNDLLSRLISGGHDEEVIRDMVISLVMAGRDTTSAALTWLLWLLSSHHREMEKEVVKEVLMVASEETGGRLNYNSLKKMKVLKACLYESMRLYPPVAWDSKHAADIDTLPDGTNAGKGDRVTYFPYGMGRMERVWGKDRLEFRPQRWLDPSEREIVKVSPYKFPVFQGGPRVCLGKEMAFTQMKYVAAAVLRQFEIRPVSQEEPVFVPLLTAHMAGGFKVMVRKRHFL